MKIVSMLRRKMQGIKLRPLASYAKYRPSRSVGTRLFLMFVISIMVFVSAVGIVSYYVSRQAIEQKVSETSYQTITQAVEKMDVVLNSYSKMSMQIMVDPNLTDWIKKYLSAPEHSYDQVQAMNNIREVLQGYTAGQNALEDIYLIPVGTNEKAFSTETTVQLSDEVKNSSWMQQVVKNQGRAVWSDTLLTGVNKSHEPTIVVSRLMTDLFSKKQKFVVVVEIHMRSLAEMFNTINMGEGTSVSLVNRNGQFIYHPDAAMVTKPAPEWLVPADKEQGMWSGTEHVHSSDNTDLLKVYHESKENKWTAVGTIPVEVLVEDAGVILIVTFVSIIVAAIFAMVIGYVATRMIASPLVALRNLMSRAADGKLTVRATVNSKDEIGELSGGFNQMMEQITQLMKHTDSSARHVLDTAQQLTNASKSTGVAAEEIALATEEIAKGALSLASEAERGHDLTQQMASQTQLVVHANEKMEQSASLVQQSSRLGASYMSSLKERTDAVEDTIRLLTNRVNELSNSTASIRNVLKVLQDMTKQTNILSLNATIEAARAGAAGRGFRVVADEIHNLADQSRQSINMVADITQRIEQEMKDTVETLHEAFPTFQLQKEAVQETDEIFKQVGQRMTDMNVHLDEVGQSVEELHRVQSIIVDAMSNVSAVSEESSATSEEVASLSQEQLNVSKQLIGLSNQLESVSNELQQSLSQFQYQEEEEQEQASSS
ncbi:methyl-accepting chemotaxis protein [Paenibacillus assamensis]|uniref:methyl-accepting chemotaxis protein n=1 Tax=Paenibacillus assamensis TaxID=311244 RepID=UPI0003FFF421|nr:methyl-accepting chemotaxis protein [Paenibacillus assamensis]